MQKDKQDLQASELPPSTKIKSRHPSRSLELRLKGYGIGGGYERPYKQRRSQAKDSSRQVYGPLPHGGYYGSGNALRPFKLGQAGFGSELNWYRSQYGRETSGYQEDK